MTELSDGEICRQGRLFSLLQQQSIILIQCTVLSTGPAQCISTYQGMNIAVPDQVLWILQVPIVLGESMKSPQIEFINMKITYVSCSLQKNKSWC